MRSLFVMDPLDRIVVSGDSTYVTMRECTDRGFGVWMCTPGDLSSLSGRGRARATPVRTTAEAPYFHVEAPVDLDLGDFDVVWMRKDPPFDMHYIFTTYLLQMAPPHTLVINDPRGLALFNEKMWVQARWPELQPATFIHRDPSALVDFVRSRAERTVLKPWDGNGGRGVLVTNGTDPNLSSMVEVLTQEGQHYVIAQAYIPEVEQGDKRILLFDGEPVGVINRVPVPGDHRANMHAGAQVQATELDPRDREICDALGPVLREWGADLRGNRRDRRHPHRDQHHEPDRPAGGEPPLWQEARGRPGRRGLASPRRPPGGRMTGWWLGAALCLASPASGTDTSAETNAETKAESLPYSEAAYRGAEVLQMEPAFVAGIQDGLNLIYLRKYDRTLQHFTALEQQYPGTGLQAVAETLVWQAKMLENFDYRYDKQYWAASKKARQQVEQSLDTPGNEAWEHLLLATMLGIESIHTMRQDHYLSALRLAFQAMDHISHSRERAPDFIDLQLADGLYNYWRTVITQKSRMLPDFGDHRAEGIEQIRRVERNGIFVKPMATLALAFVYVEEKEMPKAAGACARNRQAYPDNIINNLIGGLIEIDRRNFDDAQRMLSDVHRVDPTNTRAVYWQGLAHLRSGEYEAAKQKFMAYLATDHLEKYQRSFANYRLGVTYERQREFALAAEHYTAAIKVDGHKGAKASLERLKERRKQGHIDW